MDSFWLRITALFIAALTAWELISEWRTGEFASGVLNVFANQHPGGRRPLLWAMTVLLGVGIMLLLYVAVSP